jgi:hypothetical protein
MREVHRYPYTTWQGDLLYWNVRFENPKTFRPEMPDGTQALTCDRVLYRLPDLYAWRKDSLIWLVEGEKDADRLAAEGLHSTTAGSASSLNTTNLSPIHIAYGVVVVPDCDDAGKKWTDVATTKLYKMGQRRIYVLNLGGTDGYDVSDYLDEHTIDELMELRSTTKKWKWKPRAKPIRKRGPGGVGLPWPVEDIAWELGQKRVYGDGVVVYCPAHEDEGSGSPGLSLTRSEKDDDKTMVNCFSGCEFPDIAEAVKEAMT